MFKNSVALKTGIPRKECNTSRSLSPVIMQDALAAMASLGNLLSFGSRKAALANPVKALRSE
ncbi:MAG: hypothetical protein QM763_08840 [Agriterribacter sp.]